MRPYFLISTILICSVSYGQLEIDPETGRYTYSNVISVDTVPADQLYNKGIQWFADAFIDSRKVIELHDPNTLTIIGNPKFKTVTGGYIKFRLTLQFKKGKYRYEITNFQHLYKTCSPSPLESDKPSCSTSWGGFASKKKWQQVRGHTDQTIIALISDLDQYMKKPSEKW